MRIFIIEQHKELHNQNVGVRWDRLIVSETDKNLTIVARKLMSLGHGCALRPSRIELSVHPCSYCTCQQNQSRRHRHTALRWQGRTLL